VEHYAVFLHATVEQFPKVFLRRPIELNFVHCEPGKIRLASSTQGARRNTSTWDASTKLVCSKRQSESILTVLSYMGISRLLKHRTTRSLNARFVYKAEHFCSRCQTRVFLIHSLKNRFQLLCRRRNHRQPRLRHPRRIPEEPGPQSSHLTPNFSPESWLHTSSRRSGERPMR